MIISGTDMEIIYPLAHRKHELQWKIYKHSCEQICKYEAQDTNRKQRKDFWLQQRKQDTGKWPEHEVMYMLGPVQAVLLVLHFPLIPVCWQSTGCLKGQAVARAWHYCEAKPKNTACEARLSLLHVDELGVHSNVSAKGGFAKLQINQPVLQKE